MAALPRESGISLLLTYPVYAALLNRIDALPLNVTYIFEIASKVVSRK
jgi:hypothetical protein